jgi:ankyrin repeat protein
VRLLLDAGADVNAADGCRWSALLMASVWGNADTVRLLLERGADIQARESNGLTALMRASGVVRILLNMGADVHAKGGNGEIALSLAQSDDVKELLVQSMSAADYVLK